MSNQKKKPNGKRNFKNTKKYSKDKEKQPEKSNNSMNDALNVNDPTWYFRDPVLKSGLTRMPTFEFLGTDIATNPDFNDSGHIFSDEEIARMGCTIESPTLAVHYLNPSPGRANSGSTAAINRASRILYSKLTASNAKTSNYAPQDIIMLMLSIGELISGINDMTRLYGITNYYTKLNRSVPSVFLRAYNITEANEKAWIEYLPDFRARLNKLITNANAISFPDNYPYFKKCAYIYQHVYKDNETDMTAYHMMRPYSTWELDETSYSVGTILKTKKLDTHAPDYEMRILEKLLDDILTSLTYNAIYADVLNLLNRGVLGSNLISFATIPIDYWVEPIYSDQYNWQMMNEHIYGEPNHTITDHQLDGRTPFNDVYPLITNDVFYEPRWETDPSVTWYENIRDFHEPIIRLPGVNASEDDLVECLAYSGCNTFSVQHHNDEGAGTIRTYSYIGDTNIPDHYVVQVSIFHGDVNDNSVITFDSGILWFAGSNNIVSALAGEFEHFPIIHMFTGYYTTGSGFRYPVGDRIYGRLNVYTTDMIKALGNLRFAGYLGLFTPE